MFVSVVITAYNSGEYFRETLASATRQTYPRREIIVVDDGSREISRQLIADAVAAFPEVRLLRQPNGGLSAARNAGVAAARGEVISFLDHDDLWHPEFLERLMARLLNDPSLEAVFCRVEHLTAEGRATGRFSRPKLKGFTVRDFLVSDPLCCGSSFLIRRAAFERAGCFAPDFRQAEMPEFFIRFLRCSGRMEGVDEILVRYRNSPQSLSAGRTLQQARRRVMARALEAGAPACSLTLVRMQMLWNQFRIQLRRWLLTFTPLSKLSRGRLQRP